MLAFLKKHGCVKTNLFISGIITLLSVTLTFIALLLFQGYVDALGIHLSILAPLIIFPLPAHLFFKNVLKLDKTEKILRKQNTALEKALSQVKQLSGLLPICANCKKIRDDDDYWVEVDAYIKKHTNADFSHSLCPNCVQKLYGEYYGDDSSATTI